MTFGHSPSLIRKVLGIDPKNVIHRACVYNVGLHNDNVPKHLPLHSPAEKKVIAPNHISMNGEMRRLFENWAAT